MTLTSNLRRFIVTFAALFAAACGKEDPGKDAGAPPPEGPLLPWTEGNTWTYRVTTAGVESTKVTTIGAEEPVRGTGPNEATTAFKVVTRKGVDQADQTVSWQKVEGTRVVRYREQAFSDTTGELELEEHWDPSKLHVDQAKERLTSGADWIEVYQETKIRVVAGTPSPEPPQESRDLWTVVAERESVTVPAGTFEAVVLRKLPSDKTYWYSRGVGKVKETGGQTEELVDYEVSE